MDFGEIVKVIVDYGAVPVLIALLIFVIVMWVKTQSASKKAEDEREEERLKQNAEQEARMGEMFNKFIEKMSITPNHSKEEEEDNRRVNDFIDSQLSCLLQEEKANRSYVFMYHNGGKDMAGRSFQKMSISNEMVDLYTTPIMRSFQNVPRSMFPTLFRTLVNQDIYSIEDVEIVKETDPVLYQMFKTHAVKAAFIHAIKRSDGMVLGFVVIEYSSNICEDVERVKENLEKRTLRISGALIGAGN